jgi:hypothetical protein
MDGRPPRSELLISATEFKAKCLGLLDQLTARTLDKVVITKRGQVAGVLTAPPAHWEPPAPLWGCMAGTFQVDPEVDLTEPIIDMLDGFGDLPGAG